MEAILTAYTLRNQLIHRVRKKKNRQRCLSYLFAFVWMTFLKHLCVSGCNFSCVSRGSQLSVKDNQPQLNGPSLKVKNIHLMNAYWVSHCAEEYFERKSDMFSAFFQVVCELGTE